MRGRGGGRVGAGIAWRRGVEDDSALHCAALLTHALCRWVGGAGEPLTALCRASRLCLHCLPGRGGLARAAQPPGLSLVCRRTSNPHPSPLPSPPTITTPPPQPPLQNYTHCAHPLAAAGRVWLCGKSGMIIGDLPPYEAFPIGGTNSVRGYNEGGWAARVAR